jgi:hypothetical protein
MGGADGRVGGQGCCAAALIGVVELFLAYAEFSSYKRSKLNARLRCSSTEEFEVSHPSRKNKDAARVGHPVFPNPELVAGRGRAILVVIPLPVIVTAENDNG